MARKQLKPPVQTELFELESPKSWTGANNLVWPACFEHSQDVKDAWLAWLKYRKERRLPHTVTTLRAHLRKLIEYPPNIAAEALWAAIGRGWRDVFPESLAPTPLQNTASTERYQRSEEKQRASRADYQRRQQQCRDEKADAQRREEKYGAKLDAMSEPEMAELIAGTVWAKVSRRLRMAAGSQFRCDLLEAIELRNGRN